jgi:hypothetical protein
MTGRSLKKQEIEFSSDKQEYAMDISDLIQGTYLVQIITHRFAGIKKVFIN